MKWDEDMSDSCMELKQVDFAYDQNIQVLKQITFQVERGESVGLIGANGVGKSTLLKLMVGLNGNYTGEIRIGGMYVCPQNLSSVREKTGYVFQDSENQLFMSSVYEDVAFGPRNYGLSEDEVESRVKEALRQMRIEHLSGKLIYKLSGGEKKMAAIATILSMKPEIILMDEPTIALDPKNRRNLIRILNELPQTKLIASHDLDMIYDTCSRVILMDRGTIVADGETDKILTDGELLEKHGLELPLCMQGRGRHESRV